MARLATAMCLAILSALAAGPAGAATPDAPKSVKTQTIKPAEAGEAPAADAAETRTEISKDIDALPEPVRRMRERIMEAARTGDPEAMRKVFESNELPPSLPESADAGDPVETLKALSGDQEGLEILAIILELLEAGYAHTGIGTPQEMYVWPYFAALPFAALTPEQTVDLYRIITPDDRQGMEEFGQYVFFRIGIGPDGVWHFLLTGD